VYTCHGRKWEKVCIKYRNDRLHSEQGLVLGVQRRDDLGSRPDHHLEPEQEQQGQRWLLLYSLGRTANIRARYGYRKQVKVIVLEDLKLRITWAVILYI